MKSCARRRCPAVAFLLLVCVLLGVRRVVLDEWYVDMTRPRVAEDEHDVAIQDDGVVNFFLHIDTNETDDYSGPVKLECCSWQQKRQALLAQNGPRKVFMFAYMRGGSSIGGELFNRDPNAVLWYEPLEQYYMAYFGAQRRGLPSSYTMHSNLTQRTLHQEERRWYRNYFRDLFTCNYTRLPTEALSHTTFISNSRALKPALVSCTTDMLWQCQDFIKDQCGSAERNVRDIQLSWFHQCPDIIQMMKTIRPARFSQELVEDITSHLNNPNVDLTKFFDHFNCIEKIKTKMAPCLENAINTCTNRSIQAVEVVRANMKDLELLIDDMPDLYVLFYVRDPRAVAASVLRTEHLASNKTAGSLFAEVKYVCSKMAQDIEAYYKLAQTYPGVFMLMKYEELVLNNIRFADKVYAHLGLGRGTEEWAAFSNHALHSSRTAGQFGIQRENGLASIDQWRDGVSDEELANINAYCRDALAELNYPL